MAISDHLRSEGHDLGEVALPQLAGDRTEDAGALGVVLVPQDHGGVVVEADRIAGVPAQGGPGAHHHGLDHVRLLDAHVGHGVLDGGHDHVADVGVATVGAEHTDALDALGAAVVGDVEEGFLLNHGAFLNRCWWW